MRAVLNVAVDPALIERIIQVRKDMNTDTSKAVEHLIKLGLDHYESPRAAIPR